MTLSKTPARLSWAAAALLLIAAGLSYYAGTASGSVPPWGVAMVGLLGALIAIVCGIHATLQRLAAEEARDNANRPADPAALFRQDEQGNDAVKAHNLRQFQRVGLPGITGVLALTELLFALICWRLVGLERVLVPERLVLSAVILFVVSVLLYLLGSYIAGLAFSDKAPSLRPIAGDAVAMAWLGGLAGVAQLLMLTDFVAAGNWFARVVAVLLLLRGAEKIVNIFLEIYRPRQQRKVSYPHESRLNGLIAQPRNIMSNLAETLNYQFGLQLTEAQMRRLGWQVLPFVALQLIILFAFSSVLVVNPGEQAIIERFGRPLEQVRGPGLHVKLPWPIDRVNRVDVQTTRALTIGSALPIDSELNTVLWSDLEAAPGQLLVVANSDVDSRALEETDTPRVAAFNLMGVSAVVRYRVADIRSFVYSAIDTREVLLRLSRQQITRYLAGNDLLATLESSEEGGNGAPAAALNAELTSALAAAADELELGIEIVSLGLVYVQPPRQVVDAFQEIIVAGEERQRLVLDMRTEVLESSAAAQLEAMQIRNEAFGYAILRTQLAQADRDSFLDRQQVYQAYPEIYRAREYFFTLRRALAGRKKIIMAIEPKETTGVLDLQRRAGSDLLDLQP